MTLHPSRYFFYACAGFIAGIAISGIGTLPDAALLALLGGGVLGAVIFLQAKPRIAAACLAVATIGLGGIRGGDAAQQWSHERNEFLNISLRGAGDLTAVVAKREATANAMRYRIERIAYTPADAANETLRPDAVWSFLFTGHETFRAGDRISLTAIKFDTATTADAFLRREGIAGSIIFPREVVRRENICDEELGVAVPCARYRVNEALSVIKGSFERGLAASLPEPHASLAAGLLLGSRTGLPQDLKDAFARTGLTHIIAVSGYNVTIVVLAVSTILSFLMLPRRRAFWISTAFICFFTLITGASASVVRAAAMGFLVILAQKESRMYSARVAIAFAGALMLAENPLLLANDLGFALSFLATMGLLVIFPLLEEHFANLPRLFGIKDLMVQTVSAQLAVLPLIIMAFGSLPLIFLLSNAAVLPVIPAAMFFGFFGGLAGMFSDVCGRVLSVPAYAFLQYQISVVRLFASFPFASVSIEVLWLRLTLGCGAAIFVIWLVWKLRRRAMHTAVPIEE